MKKTVNTKTPDEQIAEFNKATEELGNPLAPKPKTKLRWFHAPFLLLIIISLLCMASVPILVVIAIVKYLF